MINIESQFNTTVGIPNVNINKASGVSDQEVNANNTSTQSLCQLWLEHIKKGLDQTNKFYGLNLSCDLRFKQEELEVTDRGAVDDGAL